MKPVTFIQYVLPNGRKRPTEVNLPDDVGDKAHALQGQGMSFEAEILATGEVSLTMVGEDDEGEERDLEIEVVANGQGMVQAAAILLIDRAYKNHMRKTP